MGRKPTLSFCCHNFPAKNSLSLSHSRSSSPPDSDLRLLFSAQQSQQKFRSGQSNRIMEFDIPLPEELELLEANSYFPEEEEDDYLNFEEAPYPYPIDGDEEERAGMKDTHVRQSESPSAEVDISGWKRPRKLMSDPIANLDEVSPAADKRSKTDYNRVEMEDEDWLRLSPVKEVVDVMEEEEEEVIPQETILSRLLLFTKHSDTEILISFFSNLVYWNFQIRF